MASFKIVEWVGISIVECSQPKGIKLKMGT